MSDIPYSVRSSRKAILPYASFSMAGNMGSSVASDVNGGFVEIAGSGDITTNSGTFTVNTSGIYLISFSVYFISETYSLSLKLFKDTEAICRVVFFDTGHGSGGGGHDAIDAFSTTGSVMTPINAGQVIKMAYVSQNQVQPMEQNVADGQRTWINFLKVS